MSEVISDAAHEMRGAITELKTAISSQIHQLTATIADRADQLMDVLSKTPARTIINANATPEQFRILTEAMEGKPEDDKPKYYLINSRDISMITAFKHESIKTIERQIDGRNLDDFEVLVDDANGVRLIDLAGREPGEIPSLLS